MQRQAESAPSEEVQRDKLSGPIESFYLDRLLRCLQSVRGGDFNVRMPADLQGIEGKIADTLNAIVATNQHMARQLEHVGEVVGRGGKTRKRVTLGLPHGAWGE